MPNVQGIAKTCFRVNKDRNVHSLADRDGMLRNFGQRDEPEIRHPPKRICYPGAGEIHGFEAEVLDDASGECICRARHEHSAAFGQLRAQQSSGAKTQSLPSQLESQILRDYSTPTSEDLPLFLSHEMGSRVC